MPPRKSRSLTPRATGNAEDLSKNSPVAALAPALDLPKADPKAVQKLIDEAIARAQKGRVSTPRTLLAREKRGSLGFLSRLFGNCDCVYSPRVTAMLTDLAGTFLVLCFAIYFTTAGYLLYREFALSQ